MLESLLFMITSDEAVMGVAIFRSHDYGTIVNTCIVNLLIVEQNRIWYGVIYDIFMLGQHNVCD